MLKLSIKFMSVLLILGLNYSGLFAVGQALAYYFDNESSGGNSFSAASLDFSFTNFQVEHAIGLNEDFTFNSVLMNNGSLPFQYTYAVEKMSGNDNFCNALGLEAKLNGVKKHDNGLMAFAGGPETTLGTWRFEFELPYDAIGFSHGDICELDFVFKGWQMEMPSYGSGGFSDEERIRVILTANMIVLNEFLPKPDGIAYGFDFGNDSSDMPQGEWVEIYNNSDSAFDLAGWYIKDSLESDTNKIIITALNTYPASTVINGKSWLVVFMNKAVLNNTGDTVKLYDISNTLIDSYSYANPPDYCDIEPTPGDENSTTAIGSCADVPSNKSYARIPDGIGDWVDPVPTPGWMNSLYATAIPILTPSVQASVQENVLVEELVIEEDTTPTVEEISEPEPVVEEIAEEIIVEEEEIVEEIVETVTEEETVLVEEVVETVIEEEPVVEQLVEEVIETLVEEGGAIIEEEAPVVQEEINT